MSDDLEARLRNLRSGVGAVIEILEGVKQQTRSFAEKQLDAEKASAKARSNFIYLKAQLAKQNNELARDKARIAMPRSHDQVYLSWLAVNTNLAVIAYFRRLRDNWCRSARPTLPPL
jgi:hypothetical protein